MRSSNGAASRTVQPYIKLNALEKSPHVRFDWTAQKLADVQRWSNGFAWRGGKTFDQYDRSRKVTRSKPMTI